MRIYLLLAMAAGLSFIGSNCGGSGVGDPCTPEDEYLTGFSGFSVSEVNVESRSFQCLTRVCLVNHFQGRVSCPYGQVEDDSPKDTGFSKCMGDIADRNSVECQPGGSNHQNSCQVPDRDGSSWDDRIIPPVEAQLKTRTADDAVYCSCRCGPPEGASGDGANFCECPSGFTCTELVEDLGLGKGNLAGKYCIKKGTEYDINSQDDAKCNSNDRCDKKYDVTIGEVTVGTNQKSGSCLPPGASCEDGVDTCCGVPQPSGARDHNLLEDDDPGTCIPGPGNPLCEQLYAVTKAECSGGSCPSR